MDSSIESSGSSTGNPVRCRRTCKIIVIGDAGVGKTCLTHRFCTGQFPSRTEATIGVDFREKLIEFEGEKIKVRQKKVFFFTVFWFVMKHVYIVSLL